MRLRAPRADETTEVAELLTAAAEESGLGSVEPEEVAQWFTSPTFDVERNFRVAERDGTLVAYCDLTTASDEETYVSHFLACDEDEVAGFAFCVAESSRHPGYGWVDTLGVRRPWRKRGLGEALLRQAFGELHRRGCRGAGLDVDAESLTGATRLYERVGMRVVSRGDTYELEVRSG